VSSIIIISGRQEGDFYRLGQKTNVIGRDETLPIQIIDNHISRRHMQIRFNRNNGSYSALDMGSKNGVLINDVKIDKETVLADGYYIIIGQHASYVYNKRFF